MRPGVWSTRRSPRVTPGSGVRARLPALRTASTSAPYDQNLMTEWHARYGGRGEGLSGINRGLRAVSLVQSGQPLLGRLRTRYGPGVIDNEERHTRDLQVGRTPLDFDHQLPHPLAHERLGGPVGVETAACRYIHEHVLAAHIPPVLEVCAEERLNERVRLALPSRVGDQHVSATRVRGALDAIEHERNPFSRAKLSKVSIQGGGAIGPKLLGAVAGALHTLGRHVRVEFKREPLDRGAVANAELVKGSLEAALADQAPGTNHVREHRDGQRHAKGLVFIAETGWLRVPLRWCWLAHARR